MAESMLKAEVEVYSEEYDIHGVIRDYGVVTKLFFSYKGKNIVMGVHRNPLSGDSYEEVGRKVIDSYIRNLSQKESDRKLQLHYWYIDEMEYSGRKYLIGHGVVTGHKRLQDSTTMSTSAVQSVRVDEEVGEAVITTKNSVYHCPLEYCLFAEQDAFPDIISEYEELKKKYQGTIERPSIEPGKVLLVLSDFCDYYFHSVYYVPENSKDNNPLRFSGHAHVGTYQDSFLIEIPDARMDLRYFPHYQSIEFYEMETREKPLYIENIGGSVIYARTFSGTIRLDPGNRKLVSEENAEKDTPVLPDGDLYPAGIIE